MVPFLKLLVPRVPTQKWRVAIVPFQNLVVQVFSQFETGGSNDLLPKTVGSKISLFRNRGLQSFHSNFWFHLETGGSSVLFTLKLEIPMIFHLETDNIKVSVYRNWWFQWFPCLNCRFQRSPTSKRGVSILPFQNPSLIGWVFLH